MASSTRRSRRGFSSRTRRPGSGFLRDRSDPAHRIDPLTAEEEARLLGTARHSYPRHFSLLLCALLQWGDIDFQGRFIEVRRSLVEGGRIELPKNGKIRRVDLSLLFGETLEKLRVRRAEEALAKGLEADPRVGILQR